MHKLKNLLNKKKEIKFLKSPQMKRGRRSGRKEKNQEGEGEKRITVKQL